GGEEGEKWPGCLRRAQPMQRRGRTSMKRSLFLLAAFTVGCLLPALPPRALAQQEKPKPDVADAKYGPHERNVIDLWKAKSDTPTPLVVFIHGGGFPAGGKSNPPPPLLPRCLKTVISVA